MSKNLPKLIVILGPTASGKSALAVDIARHFNGEIISADSRQVYRGMDIGTGKITKKEMQGVPHYLLDVASPKQRFTVAQYKKLTLAAIKKIQRKNKVPIICGGTGFYIQAVTDNIAIPEVKPDLKLRARLEKKSIAKLYTDLKRLDPARAKTIDQKNPRRLIRALEIVLKTGKPVPKFKTETAFDTLFLGIKKSSQELQWLIHKRLLKRMGQGMIKEVQTLRNSGLSWERLDSFGLEYRWISRYLKSLSAVKTRMSERSFAPKNLELRMTKRQMIERLQKDIEHYAKRQMTWFKRDKQIHWLKNKTQAQKILNKFINEKAATQ